ncbi:hypothetical protein JAAARDRAFT_55979 [Jaapia argillacea MUCL 33604]|uniref:Cyclin N-terminal domain-containing protein n=1 Tax=Jaapia argillacea MUCL 33604 TaxID=933084 RepID=A0A067QCR8_9AGAM|nr:hypothetical protein JAAARDRAFT_55979 [Jaapia argillacea MUCL 33604]
MVVLPTRNRKRLGLEQSSSSKGLKEDKVISPAALSSASLVHPSLHHPRIEELLQLLPTSPPVIDYIVRITTEVVEHSFRPNQFGGDASFKPFVQTVLKRSAFGTGMILASASYIKRAKVYLDIKHPQWALHRVFMGALLCASKYLNDSHYKIIHWTHIVKEFGKGDLARMEREWCDVLDFDFAISEEDVLSHYEALRGALPKSSRSSTPEASLSTFPTESAKLARKSSSTSSLTSHTSPPSSSPSYTPPELTVSSSSSSTSSSPDSDSPQTPSPSQNSSSLPPRFSQKHHLHTHHHHSNPIGVQHQYQYSLIPKIHTNTGKAKYQEPDSDLEIDFEAQLVQQLNSLAWPPAPSSATSSSSSSSRSRSRSRSPSPTEEEDEPTRRRSRRQLTVNARRSLRGCTKDQEKDLRPTRVSPYPTFRCTRSRSAGVVR